MNSSRNNRPYSADRAVFASRLQEAIDRQGLTYEETARRAREFLPSDARLSAVSVWQYANGKTFPRRLSYIEALSRVLEIEPEELLAKPETPAEGAEETKAQTGSPTQVRVEDLNHGRARLIIDVEVPWPLALRVLALLKVPDETPTPPEE